mmetsp:Transcript_19745/g.33849  ORF Transcript_19745/g.33849 Transcript_19745/m.33849 type:complete len:203 (+) Transcript_19745:29-637(+)
MDVNIQLEQIGGPLDDFMFGDNSNESQETRDPSLPPRPYHPNDGTLTIPISPPTLYVYLGKRRTGTPHKLKSLPVGMNGQLKTLREMGENVATYTPPNSNSPRNSQPRTSSSDQPLSRLVSSELFSAIELERQASDLTVEGLIAVATVLTSSYSTSFKVVKLDSSKVTRGYFAQKRSSYVPNLCTIAEEETAHNDESESDWD